jgi:hypothetical protein
MGRMEEERKANTEKDMKRTEEKRRGWLDIPTRSKWKKRGKWKEYVTKVFSWKMDKLDGWWMVDGGWRKIWWRWIWILWRVIFILIYIFEKALSRPGLVSRDYAGRKINKKINNLPFFSEKIAKHNIWPLISLLIMLPLTDGNHSLCMHSL